MDTLVHALTHYYSGHAPCVQGLRTQHAHVARAALYSIMHAHGPENARIHCSLPLRSCATRSLQSSCICASMPLLLDVVAMPLHASAPASSSGVPGGAVNNDLRARTTHEVDTVTGR